MRAKCDAGLARKGGYLILSLGLLFNTGGLGVVRANQWIYTDSLQNGWENWSWGTVNFANSNPVHSGAQSVSAGLGAWQAISVHHTAFDSSSYADLSFWIHGGVSGGQRLQAAALVNGVVQSFVALAPLTANTWQPVTISLAALGVANAPNLDGFWIQDRSGSTQPTFYLDDIQLTVVPEPSAASLMLVGSSAGLFLLAGLKRRRQS